jgi:hypothetical protein
VRPIPSVDPVTKATGRSSADALPSMHAMHAMNTGATRIGNFRISFFFVQTLLSSDLTRGNIQYPAFPKNVASSSLMNTIDNLQLPLT